MVVPILDWETTAFSPPILALLLFVSIATFPSLLLPSAPSMWLAGVTFGYGYGFVLITTGISIGMSLPFLIGSLFRCRIHVSPLSLLHMSDQQISTNLMTSYCGDLM